MKIDWKPEEGWRSVPELAVTCPFCGAKPGARCTKMSGYDVGGDYPPGSYTHPHRQGAYAGVVTGYQRGLEQGAKDTRQQVVGELTRWLLEQDRESVLGAVALDQLDPLLLVDTA